MVLDENSNQNLDLKLVWIRKHGPLKEAFDHNSHTLSHTLSHTFFKLNYLQIRPFSILQLWIKREYCFYIFKLA